MGTLNLDLDAALAMAGEIFNALSPVAVVAIGVGLGFYVLKLVTRMIKH